MDEDRFGRSTAGDALYESGAMVLVQWRASVSPQPSWRRRAKTN
jgi:hypothetical protein